MLKKLPKGVSDFKEIISEGYLYVDKTMYLYDLLRNEKMVFVSRPRRFGKSLTLSTLYYLLKGEKALFKDTWIYDKWDWQEWPVVRLNLTDVSSKSAETLAKELLNIVKIQALIFGITIDEDTEPNGALRELIIKAKYKFGKDVIVLVDEYEKPILDNISDKSLLSSLKKLLREFYSVLKGQEEHIKFLFMTGLTKFTKMGVFSTLNNLNDVTFDERYSQMFGYNDEEILYFFKPYIDLIVEKYRISQDELIELLKEYYNGFSFDGIHKVYNPYAVVMFFAKQEFLPFWSLSGGSQFVYNYLKEKNVALDKVLGKELTEATFTRKEIENTEPVVFLTQAGYLTFSEAIRTEPLEGRVFKVGIPNIDVQTELDTLLLETQYGVQEDNLVDKVRALKNSIKNSIKEEKFEDMITVLNSILSELPYESKKEISYENYLYLVFGMAGFKVDSEKHTIGGRPDLIVRWNGKVLIFELKIDEEPEIALCQIKEKGYHIPHMGKMVYLFGVNISSKSGLIQNWKVEVLNSAEGGKRV